MVNGKRLRQETDEYATPLPLNPSHTSTQIQEKNRHHSQPCFVPRQSERVKLVTVRLSLFKFHRSSSPLKPILAGVRPPVQSARHSVVAAWAPAAVAVIFAVARGVTSRLHHIDFAGCWPGTVAVMLEGYA